MLRGAMQTARPLFSSRCNLFPSFSLFQGEGGEHDEKDPVVFAAAAGSGHRRRPDAAGGPFPRGGTAAAGADAGAGHPTAAGAGTGARGKYESFAVYTASFTLEEVRYSLRFQQLDMKDVVKVVASIIRGDDRIEVK